MNIDAWRSWPLFNNSLTAWLIAGGVTAVALTVLLLLRPLVKNYSERLRKTERTEVLEIPMAVLSRTSVLFLIALALFLGSQALNLGPKLAVTIRSIMTIARHSARSASSASSRAW